MVAKIWKYFSKITVNGEVRRKCLKCWKLLPSPKDLSTSNMINHLESKGHEDILEETGGPRYTPQTGHFYKFVISFQ